MTIAEITNKYKSKIDYLDLEILIANSLNKSREFVLTHPEKSLTEFQIKNFKLKISQRTKGEPIAYILGHKEFYGLDFVVNKHTLVPRPETELMVEQALSSACLPARQVTSHQSSGEKITIIDVGTGSGCIIISIANEIENKNSCTTRNLDSRLATNSKMKYYATDISEGALDVARKNAKNRSLNKKIKFIKGNLLTPLIGNWKLVPGISSEQKIGNSRIVILANLPYLSKEIYNSAPIDVKKFEPKSALYSPEFGLKHYRELLEQLQQIIATSYGLRVTVFLEISPEQKTLLTKIIKNIFPSAKTEFKKDLARKWRICIVTIHTSPSP